MLRTEASIRCSALRAPQSKHTVIRPHFGPKTPPPSAPPKAVPERMLDLPTADFVEEEPAAARPAAFQEVFCPCGEALTVGMEEVGKNMQCPTCFTLMAVDQVRDPSSGLFVVRVRAIGKMDQDTWSLSDFS